MLRARQGQEGDDIVGHHRFIPVTLDISVLDPAPAPPGQKGGEPDDSQDVIDDLIKGIKQLRPKNKGGKAYKVDKVIQKSR